MYNVYSGSHWIYFSYPSSFAHSIQMLNMMLIQSNLRGINDWLVNILEFPLLLSFSKANVCSQ